MPPDRAASGHRQRGPLRAGRCRISCKYREGGRRSLLYAPGPGIKAASGAVSIARDMGRRLGQQIVQARNVTLFACALLRAPICARAVKCLFYRNDLAIDAHGRPRFSFTLDRRLFALPRARSLSLQRARLGIGAASLYDSGPPEHERPRGRRLAYRAVSAIWGVIHPMAFQGMYNLRPFGREGSSANGTNQGGCRQADQPGAALGYLWPSVHPVPFFCRATSPHTTASVYGPYPT